jgi:glycosyltransferase involved in cell wall biosynthesis
MRICFFKPGSLVTGGGAENWMIEVSRRLAKRHEVGIVGLRYSETKRLDISEITSSLKGVEYREFSSTTLPRGSPLPNPFRVSRLLNLFNSYDLTYVIVPNPPIELLFYFLRMNITCRLIAGFHGFPRLDLFLERLYAPLFQKSLSAFQTYHVLNKETYHWLQNMGFQRIFNIPNGVNTDVFPLREDSSDSRSFNVLYTGRLTEDKGADKLVEIIRYVNEKSSIRNTKFTIVGSGPLEGIVKETARRYKNVNYLGFVPSKVLPRLCGIAHLYLIPSRTEGMPLRLLEAQSCGLPAAGSKTMGISDVVVDGKTGRLTSFGNIKGYAETIKEYYELWYNSPDRFRQLKKAIRAYIISNFDWRVVIDRLERMFSQETSRKADTTTYR